jgi:hypothetical protein
VGLSAAWEAVLDELGAWRDVQADWFTGREVDA